MAGIRHAMAMTHPKKPRKVALNRLAGLIYVDMKEDKNDGFWRLTTFDIFVMM